MPVDFSSLLADTLSNRGYEVEDASPVEGASGASYPVSMVAHREGERFLVDALASRTVRDEDVQAVASIVDDAGLDGAIVLALNGEEHSASGPGADRVEVWSRERVERCVGALVVDGHLEAGAQADEIGPSPVDPYAAAERTTPPDEAEKRDPDGPARDASPPQAASGPAPSPSQTQASSNPDTTAEPDPEPAPEPQANPEPATVEAEDTPEEPTPAADEDVNHRDFVDPEDMLERAEQLMQEGAVDDGDAEIIVEDDDPQPEPQPGSQPEPQPEPASEPAADPPSEPAGDKSPGSSDEVEIDPGSDAEILEAGDDTSSKRPTPDGEPPEPETATTARETMATQPETDASPDEAPSPDGGTSPAAAAGPGREDETFVSGATIEPKVDETEARLTAEEAVFEAEEARLELLPFRVYRYRAQLEGDGHTSEEEGRVWVSTQSGAVVRAPNGDRVDEPEIAHERFQGSLNSAQTEQAAREHLLDSLERRDEVRQDYNEAAVIERVRLEPDPETLIVEPLGKAYAPRWRIEGRNGTVFVDAVTGELVNE